MMAETFGRADVTRFLEEMTLDDYMGWFAYWGQEQAERDKRNLTALRRFKEALDARRAKQHGPQ